MARQKQKARVISSKRIHLLFEEVIKDKALMIEGAFTPKNFAVNKWMVELAANGKLLIDGMVMRDVDLSFYAKSRFAKMIRIRRMEWAEHHDPTFFRSEDTVKGSESTETELMVQIFQDNFKYMKHLCVFLGLDTNVSDEAKQGGLLSKSAIDFLDILPKCAALETLNVVDKHCNAGHGKQISLQVKMMEIIQDLPKLHGLEWCGNMTEDMWHVAKEGEVSTRWNLFDYLPRNLTVLIISDGDNPRMLPWEVHNGVAAAVLDVMCNKDKKWKIESLLLPKSFWGLDLRYFESCIKHLNAGDIEEIGCSDEYKINEGPIARVLTRAPHALRAWRLPPPVRRLDLLARSLTRRMSIDLGVCKDAQERALRMQWIQSLKKGEGAFYNCERDADDVGFSFYNLRKKYTGSNELRRGSEFRVDMRV